MAGGLEKGGLLAAIATIRPKGVCLDFPPSIIPVLTTVSTSSYTYVCYLYPQSCNRKGLANHLNEVTNHCHVLTYLYGCSGRG